VISTIDTLPIGFLESPCSRVITIEVETVGLNPRSISLQFVTERDQLYRFFQNDTVYCICNTVHTGSLGRLMRNWGAGSYEENADKTGDTMMSIAPTIGSIDRGL